MIIIILIPIIKDWGCVLCGLFTLIQLREGRLGPFGVELQDVAAVRTSCKALPSFELGLGFRVEG